MADRNWTMTTETLQLRAMAESWRLKATQVAAKYTTAGKPSDSLLAIIAAFEYCAEGLEKFVSERVNEPVSGVSVPPTASPPP